MLEILILWFFAFALGFGLFLAIPMATAIIRKCIGPRQYSKIPQPPSIPLPKSPDHRGNGHDARVLH